MRPNKSFETARNIIKVLLGAAVVLCVLALLVGDGGGALGAYVVIAAVACIVAIVIVLAVGMRCPYCGKTIVRKCLVVEVCPHCRRNLATGLKSKKKR